MRWVQSYDSTRLVDTDSGGPANDLHVGDVDDMHVGGPSPKNPHKPGPRQYMMDGEYGNIEIWVRPTRDSEQVRSFGSGLKAAVGSADREPHVDRLGEHVRGVPAVWEPEPEEPAGLAAAGRGGDADRGAGGRGEGGRQPQRRELRAGTHACSGCICRLVTWVSIRCS